MNELSANEIRSRIQKAREFILEACTAYTISEQQNRTLITFPIPPSLRVSAATFSAPLDSTGDCRELLRDAIVALGDTNQAYNVPPFQEVPVEWSVYQPGLAARQDVKTEVEARQSLRAGYGDDLTIMYIHGGIFFLNTPGSRRTIVEHLSRTAGCKCVSPQYRLAPQNPFPAALLDILVCYLSLLYPPPGSSHSPVRPSSLVLAGDSSGACLALALIQVILHARRTTQGDGSLATVYFHGHNVPLALPAGVTCLSAALDQTLSLPSYSQRALTDLVPSDHPSSAPNFPSCAIWPTNPPREHVYAPRHLLSHPLVSPVTAQSWEGAPPLWFASGEEALADGAKVVAATAKKQGILVGWSEWEMMPHCWPLGFAKWWQSEDVLDKWGSICSQMGRSRTFEGQGLRIRIDCKSKELDVANLTDLTPQNAKAVMLKKVETMRPYVGGQKGTSRL